MKGHDNVNANVNVNVNLIFKIIFNKHINNNLWNSKSIRDINILYFVFCILHFVFCILSLDELFSMVNISKYHHCRNFNY